MLINQFATPGLGSLMARRWVVGAGQLALAFAGFLLFCAWFVDVLRQYYGLMTSDAEAHLHHQLAFGGVGLFALAWLWALVTSFSLICAAKRRERVGEFVVPCQKNPA